MSEWSADLDTLQNYPYTMDADSVVLAVKLVTFVSLTAYLLFLLLDCKLLEGRIPAFLISI